MRSPSIPRIISFLFLCLTTTILSQEISWTRQGCLDKCGNLTIPFPFGIGPTCSWNFSFDITCNNSTNPPKPFLSSINREVVNISVHGVVIVNQPISPMNCSFEPSSRSLDISIEGSPFKISSRYNSLAVLGCTNSVWLLADESTTVGGCMAICQANNVNSTQSSSCDGLNCCKATIPAGLQNFRFRYRSIGTASAYCGYAFPVDKKWFRQDYKRYTGLQNNHSFPYDQAFVSVPLALEWEINYSMRNSLASCKSAEEYRVSSYSDEYSDSSTSLDSSSYYSRYEHVSSTNYCYCRYGYKGNPYIVEGGCVDIDECAINETITYITCPLQGSCYNTTRAAYCHGGTCINTIGSYDCRYPNNGSKSKRIIALISIGSALGALLLLFAAFKATRIVRKRIKAKRRHEFFKRNGGLLLQQQLSSTDKSLEKTKLFTYKELVKATDNYNENRVLGHGGQGTS